MSAVSQTSGGHNAPAMNPVSPAQRPRARGWPALLVLLAAGLGACATLPPDTGEPTAEEQLRTSIAATNLAHTQLAALVYQDLLLNLAAGNLDAARADLCQWLLESAVFLLDAVDKLPPEFHPRTRGVLARLRDDPAGCPGVEAIAPRIDAALAALGEL